MGCERSPLRVALSPWAGYQFMALAEQEGWYAPAQVQLVKTGTLGESAKALAEGRVDVAALTLDEVLTLRANEVPVEVALIINVSAGGDALLARPGLASLADLAGKRIAVEDSSLGAVMLHHVLQAANLTTDDVVIAPMPFDHVAAWAQLAPDAILTYEPALTHLEAQGLARLFDSREMPMRILDVLAVRSGTVQRQGGAIRELIAGHFRALDLWHRNPIDTSYRLAHLLGVAVEDVKRIFSGLDLPDLLYNRRYLSPPAIELSRTAREIADIMVEANLLQQVPPLDGLFRSDGLPPESG
jgi:NitT/TauT family transport system substrate-binding protein